MVQRELSEALLLLQKTKTKIKYSEETQSRILSFLYVESN